MPPARATARSAGSTISATKGWSGASSAATGAWCRSCSSSPIANQIEAYNLPQGVITHLFRDIAAGKPGPSHARRPRHLRRSALRRRQDQRAHHRGPRRADDDRRRGIPVLQGVPDQRRRSSAARPPTPTATSRWRSEALTLEALAIAMAARNSGGIVIAQVERIAERGIAQPAPGEDPGHAGRLRRRGREAREPLADLRRAVQPGVRRRDPRCRWRRCRRWR